MGNAQSDVTSNVKAQADAQESETYKLIDVKGGGELMKLMKDPALRRNKVKLDEEIRKRIIGCLYNEGRGEEVYKLEMLIDMNLKINAFFFLIDYIIYVIIILFRTDFFSVSEP